MKISLPSVRDVPTAGKKVLVRVDLEWEDPVGQRRQATENLVDYLWRQGAGKIKLLGHKGRASFPDVEVVNDIRSDRREEQDDTGLAAELAAGWDVYVNEAFATSHRRHVSLDALPRLMRSRGQPVCIGPRFEKEVEMLDKVLSLGADTTKALVIGGIKVDDKAISAAELKRRGWIVLRGGLLPGVHLRPDGLDITDEAIRDYCRQVSRAETIVVAGPLGKFETEGAEKGTREVFAAAARSRAYKVAGGGDTEAALEKFGLTGMFDWISVGGGAMLRYLATGTLPGIQALTGELYT